MVVKFWHKQKDNVFKVYATSVEFQGEVAAIKLNNDSFAVNMECLLSINDKDANIVIGILKKNHRGTYAIFNGDTYKVKLEVFDYTCFSQNIQKSIIENGYPLVSFRVRVLHSDANSNSSYSNGREVYKGTSIEKAIEKIREYIPYSVLPQQLVKYWLII